MNTILAVKTALAADVAGIGYEGFRTWLKRGLLKTTGTLPKFYAPNAPAEVADAKRWRWSAFGFADLCSFRLTKILLDAGLPWEAVNPIVSNDDVWRSHHHDDPGCRYLTIFHRGSEWTLYSRETLADALDSGAIKSDWTTLVDLRELRQNVVFRSRAAALKAVAEDVASTSHLSAKSGAALLTPSEAAGRQRDIETCAAEIGKLATLARQGSGSYKQFEAILTGLHKMGKFPDASAVSAVAAAFVE